MTKEFPRGAFMQLAAFALLTGCAPKVAVAAAEYVAAPIPPTQPVKVLDFEDDLNELKRREAPCTLPFEGALMDGGLQFFDVITDRSKPYVDNEGRINHHLGLDFKGSARGQSVLNVCDGLFVWSGRVPGGDSTLGNVVVMKYGTVYMRYAHMENVLADVAPQTLIPMGEKIGEVGSSGGWRDPHLHVDMWTVHAWNTQLSNQTINGNLAMMAGFYPEWWDEGQVRRDLVDPKTWLSERLTIAK